MSATIRESEATVPKTRVLSLVVVLGLLAGCDGNQPTVPNLPGGTEFEIVDAAHSLGNPDFFFLPPLVPDPSGHPSFDADAFDASLSPVVEICELQGDLCVDAPPLAVFTMESGPGSETVRIDGLDGDHYVVNWHTDAFDLSAETMYRIRVLVAGTPLGHADVDVVTSGKDLKSVATNEYIALKDGRTLPIKFRIEQGAVTVVDEGGAIVTFGDGAATLTIPEGALPGPVGITGWAATQYPDTSRLIQGSAFTFGPDGLTFPADKPATLTIAYDAATLAADWYPRIHKVVGGAWVRVPGSVADLAAGTVTAPITGFSDWGALGTGAVLNLHATGGQGEVEVSPVPEGVEGVCSYNDIVCTIEYDPGTSVTLVASSLGPDAQFEDWAGTSSGFACSTDPTCVFTIAQDLDVTARFSMPGLLSLDPTTATFTIAYGSSDPPMSVAIDVSNYGGRSVSLAPVVVVYSPSVTGWLETSISSDPIQPSSSSTLTLTTLTGVASALSVGVYGATVVVRDEGGETGGIVEVTLTVTGTGVTVDGLGRHFGPLPVVPYAFADDATGTDVYPLGTTAGYYLFGLFDTGSTRVRLYSELPYYFTVYPVLDPNGGLVPNVPNRITDANWFDSDAGLLGLSATATVRVRLNGLGAIDPSNLTAPIGPPGSAGGAELEVTGVAVQLQAGLDVTLLGAPVAQQVVAVLDYTQKVVRQGYDFYPGLTDPANSGIPGFQKVNAVEGPAIAFFAPGDPAIPTVDLHLALERFGMPERWTITGLEFRHNGVVATDDPSAATPSLFLFDTGTTPTIIGSLIAGQLGLAPGTGGFSCLGGTSNGFTLDEIVVAGIDGTYTVSNPSVCVSEANVGGVISAVVGANLFDQVPVVFDGPGNTVGIGTPTSTPVSW